VTIQKRVQAGVPAGGQFAAAGHDESGIELAPESPRNTATGRTYTLDDRISALHAGIESDTVEIQELQDKAEESDNALDELDRLKPDLQESIVSQQAQLIELLEQKIAAANRYDGSEKRIEGDFGEVLVSPRDPDSGPGTFILVDTSGQTDGQPITVMINDEVHHIPVEYEDGDAGQVRVQPDGGRSWHDSENKLHRLDGPAVENADGSRAWMIHGQTHRLDGPAIENADGTCAWMVSGKYHRVGGPAIEKADGTCEWWENGSFLWSESREKCPTCSRSFCTCADRDIDGESNLNDVADALEEAYRDRDAGRAGANTVIERLSAHAAALDIRKEIPQAASVDLDWGPSLYLEPVAYLDKNGRAISVKEDPGETFMYLTNLTPGTLPYLEKFERGGRFHLDLDRAIRHE